MTTLAPVRAPILRLLRSELRWIYRRPRTLILLGLLALYPILFGIGTQVVDAPVRANGDQSVVAAVAGNAMMLPVIVLSTTMVFFLPLGTTMTASDALAGEASHGTLRGLLLAPVSRIRLLAVKAFGVAVVSAGAAVMTALIAFVTGLIIAGPDSLVTFSGTTLPLADGLWRVVVATGWVIVQMWAIGAIALAVSAATEHPLLVMASVIGGLFVFGLLSSIPVLDWLHPFLITESWDSIVDVLRDPMPWENLTTGFLRALCYIVIGYSLALARMVTKDS
ncbi:ABC transporter permease [Kibdelosporangium persicum]|uniref:ABC-type transport system involved in multi-copper enzyme maturation, permease component n=1 Tax=Kibdelosporangium persicum TaxID=2698649 RepID=A0ABX2F8R9_9PSEU|nr:ABC transporter permease subunit [Kibdelosporangium persicum]NRN67749.1 ABC-type transport system involved in multi-copper enzyme maturation, permease component [Kibdelosporangium persicum]